MVRNPFPGRGLVAHGLDEPVGLRDGGPHPVALLGGAEALGEQFVISDRCGAAHLKEMSGAFSVPSWALK